MEAAGGEALAVAQPFCERTNTVRSATDQQRNLPRVEECQYPPEALVLDDT